MGFDVTLHLVDESRIVEELVPRLLLSKKRLVLDGEPADAARALTEAAVVFASKTLPHLQARGMALSLWSAHAPKKVRGRSPLGLGSSPAILFAKAIAKRPELKKHFPLAFDENFMTGVFIPASKIAAARKWMEKHLAALSPGERLVVEPIERVLAAAEERGLAYWEATDLIVARVREQLDAAGPKAKDVVGSWRIPGTATEIVGRVDDVVLLRLGDSAACTVDLAKLPPKITKLAMDYPTSVAKVGGRWMFVERLRDVRPFRFRLIDRGTSLPVGTGNPVDVAPRWTSRAFVCAGVLGGAVYGYDEDASPRRLLRWTPGKGTFEDVAGVPPANSVVIGAARTGDGAAVLIWDGDGWELVGGRLTRTFRMGAKHNHVPWTTAPGPAGAPTFFYLSNRQVFATERGKKPKRVGSKVTNVMRLTPGPSGSLLLRMGDNRNAWAIAALDPMGRATGLRLAELVKGDVSVLGAAWSEPASALFVITERAVLAVPRSRLGV